MLPPAPGDAVILPDGSRIARLSDGSLVIHGFPEDDGEAGTAKYQRSVDLNGQETWSGDREDDPAGYAAGGGGAQHRPHDAHGAQYIPGGTPGVSAGGEPPRWDGTAPEPRAASAPDDEDDADYPGRRDAPPRPGTYWPAAYMDGYWPRGGHGSGQAGASSPGGANGRPPNGVGKGASDPGDPNPVDAEHVYSQMLANFPPQAIAWVRHVRWIGPVDVPCDRADTGDEDSWAASRQPGRVKHFTRKIRHGEDIAPGISVQKPGNGRITLVDGRHRFLASRKRGKPFRTYVGFVPRDDGPWDETHSSQVHQGAHPANKAAEPGPGPSVAGLAVLAADTGRVLMLQRALADDDPAAGRWEFPGGHAEPGESPLLAALREWAEETGCQPPRGRLTGQWDAGNGIYRGYVLTVPSEADVPVFDGRDQVINPDDPDGDATEALAWWEPGQLAGNPAVRDELAADLGIVLAAIAGNAEKAGRHGNAERLREYWSHGEGAAKIRWGEPGDFDRCVMHAGKFMADPEGYCAERHHEALGIWPATHAAMERGHKDAEPDLAKAGEEGYVHGWVCVRPPCGTKPALTPGGRVNPYTGSELVSVGGRESAGYILPGPDGTFIPESVYGGKGAPAATREAAVERLALMHNARQAADVAQAAGSAKAAGHASDAREAIMAGDDDRAGQALEDAARALRRDSAAGDIRHEDALFAHRHISDLHSSLGGTPLPAPAPQRHPASFADSAAQARLRDAIASGASSETAPDVEGITGDTAIVSLAGGARAVRKDGMSESAQEREHLAALVSDAIGAGAPALVRDNGSIWTAFADGQAGERWLAGHDPEDAYSSPSGRLVGALDWLTANRDRHSGNWIAAPDGTIVPIDHTATFGGTGSWDSEFRESLEEARERTFTAGQLAEWEKKLKALQPQFRAYGRGSWHKAMMGRLAELKASEKKKRA